MSNIYINEPPTSGKVLLVTSLGEIDVELWARETPKACRNFIQLCMEGYYDGTIFHRVVRDFCAQGGDPTGTGQGGESIYGRPFKDEIHQRLRFNRRGLVAMANSGKDDNGSQFFFTLGTAQELDRKHTIFGKVAGDTIYNMVRLNEIETEGDRPLYPPKIVKTQVLDNPFDDIIPRENIGRKKQDKDAKTSESSKKSKAKAVKNFSVLSFGEEAEDDENQLDEAIEKSFKNKSKSLHDAKVDPKMVADPALDSALPLPEERKRKNGSADDDSKAKKSKFAEPEGLEEDSEEDTDEEEERKNKEKDVVRDKLKRKKGVDAEEGKVKEEEKKEEELDSEEEEMKEKRRKLEEMQKESKKLMNELRPKKEKEAKKEKDEEDEEKVELKGDEDEITKFKVERLKYVKQKKEMKKKGPDRQDLTLQLLAKFQNKVKESQEHKLTSSEVKSEPSSEDEDAEDIRLDDPRWFSHELKASSTEPVLAKDANVNQEEMFDITDPRHPLNERRRNDDKRKGRQKDMRGKEVV